MYTQRSFLLNLSKELNKGNVSFAQFFLLGYLAVNPVSDIFADRSRKEEWFLFHGANLIAQVTARISLQFNAV